MNKSHDTLINFQLGHIDLGGRIIILEEPIILELSKAEHGEYLMTNDDFGILVIGNTLEHMIKDINEQFQVLWDAYVRPDDGLTTSGQMLKESLIGRFIMHGISFGEDGMQKLKGCKPVIVIEEPEDYALTGLSLDAKHGLIK